MAKIKRLTPADRRQLSGFVRYLSVAILLDDDLIRAARRRFFPEEEYAWLDVYLIGDHESEYAVSERTLVWVEVSNSSCITIRSDKLREMRTEIMQQPEELKNALDFLQHYRQEHEIKVKGSQEWITFEEAVIANALLGNLHEFNRLIDILYQELVNDDTNLLFARRALAVLADLPEVLAERQQKIKLKAQQCLGIIV